MRLFVAAWLPAEAVEALAALPRPTIEGVRWTGADQWHVTLLFLGRVGGCAQRHGDGAERVTDGGPRHGRLDGSEAVAAAHDALDRVGLLVGSPAVAEMGPVVELLSSRLLCAPVRGLDQVAAAVRTAFEDVGEPREARRFRGHVTLARLRHLSLKVARSLAGTPISVAWPVTEVALVRSHLGGGASGAPTRYEILDTRSLPQ